MALQKIFLEQAIERWGRVENAEPLHLTDSLPLSMGYAKQRAIAYNIPKLLLGVGGL